MKVLIIEDQPFKSKRVEYSLNRLGVTDYDTVTSVNQGIKKCLTYKWDLLIADLGLPRFPDGDVTESKEGLNMLLELGYMGIMIPTIINSPTYLRDEEYQPLNDLGYPLIAHAKTEFELDDVLTSTLTKHQEKRFTIEPK